MATLAEVVRSAREGLEQFEQSQALLLKSNAILEELLDAWDADCNRKTFRKFADTARQAIRIGQLAMAEHGLAYSRFAQEQINLLRSIGKDEQPASPN
jgi:hypothetical protein